MSASEVKYSIKELDDLVKRSGTCVTLQRKSRMLYLDPVQFSSTKSGFHAFLDVLLLKYDFIFKAIVLGYKKVKLLTECGLFCYRSSKISVLIEADFYLFNPATGSKLQGVVCKRSGQHLGCLVHKAFNVFIPLNQNNYKTGWDYAIGEEVELEVVSMDLTTGPLPYIKGQLEREEKDSEEDESEGSVIGAEDGGRHGNLWGGSDSGVASSPGRESDDSEDAESNHSYEGLTRKSLIAQLEKSTEKGKGRHSLDNSKDRTKKKSRKSVINLLPVTEECKSPITEELLVKYDKTSISITSDKEENGKELVKPNHLGSAESSIISQKRKRESLGEEKNKKRKSTSSATPQAEKTEAEIQIERLLSLNKKLLGFDSVDISEKLSTEEKKSKKRKRGSVGVKESPKKKKVDESPNVNTKIPNVIT